VGDNEAGKSTIIEAIHLALTGWFNGRYLHNELTQYLFNYQIVKEYLESIERGQPLSPPCIFIEIYIDSENLPLFNGNANSEKSNSIGFSLKIEFDDKYQDEYQILLDSGNIKSLPIEYYNFYWESFARDERVTPKLIPIKPALIDSSNNRLQNGSDIYIGRIVKDFLESKEMVDISQAHRKMKDIFMQEEAVKAINKKIQETSKISNKKVELSVELSSKNAWESTLVTYLDDIPFHHVGKGEQCIIKTKLALSHKKALEANLLLIEEPENHLSHSKLNCLIKDIKEGSSNKQIIISTHSSFVANKLGLDSLILLNDLKITRFKDLTPETFKFFEKLAGYDTLRLILCKKAILVEGDSDELIVQKAYSTKNDKRLPIEDGIDVISVGISFLRFLEIAEIINKPTVVITDNDGDLEAIQKKYHNYLGENEKDNIRISYDQSINAGELMINGKPFNYNTLEPNILRDNDL
jgi:putative ATP-dependent endonuclease of OLD family